MILIRLWLRGAILVGLVSLNTRLLADDRLIESVICAASISGVWWLNARSASQLPGGWPLVAYMFGAATGTMIGVVISRII